ncbi:MAG: hypothetical protein XD95_0121 [Microgenomates bacterium 39_7]|nr:MAG: hypothetical protein XD95_0121 [Microgenomates bacterium 39_7]
MKKKLSFISIGYTILSAIIIAGGSYLAIMYAQGNYRFTQSGVLVESGLLSANSFPTGAQVIVNGELTTATDDTIYLEPGIYTVEFKKDGYSPWRKELVIEKELVTQTNARLFPVAPSLTPLTFTGVENVLPSPDGQKLVYYTASASAETRNGLYVLDLNDSINPFQKTSRQIAVDVPLYELNNADFIWSPDSSQLMILTRLKQVIVDVNQMNNLLSLPDISFRRSEILSEWEEEMYLRERQYLAEFPEEIIEIATQSAKNVYMAPDKRKLLYTATASAVLAPEIVPPLPSTNTQPESRKIEPGNIYVYDSEEDKNFLIASDETEIDQVNKSLLADDLYQKSPRTLKASPSAFTRLQDQTVANTALRFNTYHSSLTINTLQWFADSNYLLFIKDNRVQIISYDGTNNTTLYSGPFAENFIYPWPDGSRVIILTAFSPDTPQNLYSIELK